MLSLRTHQGQGQFQGLISLQRSIKSNKRPNKVSGGRNVDGGLQVKAQVPTFCVVRLGTVQNVLLAFWSCNLLGLFFITLLL